MREYIFAKNQKPANGSSPGPNQNETNFIPSPDEIARRAYFAYANQGSPQGHEVQHWLQAEAKLIQERNRTRSHEFHNQT
jgi:hypothetical protein